MVVFVLDGGLSEISETRDAAPDTHLKNALADTPDELAATEVRFRERTRRG